MCFKGNSKITRPPFEFQRVGPVTKVPGGHKPDFTLQIARPSSQMKNRNLQNKTPRRTKMVCMDAVMLVDLIGTANYKKCKEIDLAGKKLNKIDINILRELEHLKKADCGDNCLALEPFVVIPNLEELDLSCNALKKFDFTESESLAGSTDRAWKSLKKLNIGFNSCGSFITDIMLMQNLTWLSLSHNNISELPPNMMHFANLKYLDLTCNTLNSENAFFALATVPSLQTLILDDNQIMYIPAFDFGFEALTNISLKKNKIESTENCENLCNIDSLEEAILIGSPICMKLKELPYLKEMFQDAGIDLILNEQKKQKKQVIPSVLRTINFDPLCLPSFTKQHIQALNKKTPRKRGENAAISSNANDVDFDNEFDNDIKSTENKVKDDVFMTDFGNVAQDEEPKRLEIPETPLPDEICLDSERTSIWNEVPVVQAQSRRQLRGKTKTAFDFAFKKLAFIVEHPDLRLKPRESPSSEPQQEAPKTPAPNLITRPTPNMNVASRKKKVVATQLQARTEYTKTEIQQMLRSMEERLNVVENDLTVVDESGHTAVEVALDQRNFTNLHKQYEAIRAELLNTLNS